MVAKDARTSGPVAAARLSVRSSVLYTVMVTSVSRLTCALYGGAAALLLVYHVPFGIARMSVGLVSRRCRCLLIADVLFPLYDVSATCDMSL